MSALAVNKDTIGINGTEFPRPSARAAARAGELAEGRLALVTVHSGESEFVTHGVVASVRSSGTEVFVTICPVHAYYERETTSSQYVKSQGTPWETEFRISDGSDCLTHFCVGRECDRRLVEITKTA